MRKIDTSLIIDNFDDFVKYIDKNYNIVPLGYVDEEKKMYALSSPLLKIDAFVGVNLNITKTEDLVNSVFEGTYQGILSGKFNLCDPTVLFKEAKGVSLMSLFEQYKTLLFKHEKSLINRCNLDYFGEPLDNIFVSGDKFGIETHTFYGSSEGIYTDVLLSGILHYNSDKQEKVRFCTIKTLDETEKTFNNMQKFAESFYNYSLSINYGCPAISKPEKFLNGDKTITKESNDYER